MKFIEYSRKKVPAQRNSHTQVLVARNHYKQESRKACNCTRKFLSLKGVKAVTAEKTTVGKAATGWSKQKQGKVSVISEGWTEWARRGPAPSGSSTPGYKSHPQGGTRALKYTPRSLVKQCPQKGNQGLWLCVVEVKPEMPS